MHQLSFYTDNKLHICSWDKDIAGFTGKSSSSAIGQRYFEILPRIYTDDIDALALSFRENKVLYLKEYSFNCLHSSMKADVRIVPQKTSNGSAQQVKVTLFPNSTCTIARKLNQSQHLIDIGKIASTLAHGVRSPLNAIKGAVVYLRERYDKEELLLEFTKIMEDEISRLDTFISKFLSSSFLDTEMIGTDLNSLVRKIEIYTSLQAQTHHINSSFHFGNIPSIKINSFHIEQAILNVINNAIAAMEKGGELDVKTRIENRNDTVFAVVEISDTGPGMAKKKIDELPLSSKKNGRGFGLFITQEILHCYGGHLEIKSDQSTGTTVRLYIPYT